MTRQENQQRTETKRRRQPRSQIEVHRLMEVSSEPGVVVRCPVDLCLDSGLGSWAITSFQHCPGKAHFDRHPESRTDHSGNNGNQADCNDNENNGIQNTKAASLSLLSSSSFTFVDMTGTTNSVARGSVATPLALENSTTCRSGVDMDGHEQMVRWKSCGRSFMAHMLDACCGDRHADAYLPDQVCALPNVCWTCTDSDASHREGKREHTITATASWDNKINGRACTGKTKRVREFGILLHLPWSPTFRHGPFLPESTRDKEVAAGGRK